MTDDAFTLDDYADLLQRLRAAPDDDVTAILSNNFNVVLGALAVVTPLIEAAALEEAAGWQTIENAPANTKVLVGLWLSAYRWFEIVAEKVPAEADNWIADSGRITLTPTHWHPLPAPPTEQP